MSISTVAIFPPPIPQESTDFGVKKTHKLIAFRSDQLSPHFLSNMQKFYTNNYSTTSLVDMSKNSNINAYGYTHVFDWGIEVRGEELLQAVCRKRLEVRTNVQLDELFSLAPIPPRVTWLNRVQQLLIIKCRHQELVYLVKDGEFQLHGRLEHQFNSVKCKMIRDRLKNYLYGEGIFCNLYPERRGLDITGGYSVLVTDSREGAVQLPENVIRDTTISILTP